MIDWLVLLFELAKLQIHFHPYVNQRNGCKIMRPANRKITNKTKIVNIDPHLHFIICCCCFVLAAPQGLWDLDSWIRDQTLASCSRSRKSKPLDHRESPLLVFFFFFFWVLHLPQHPSVLCLVTQSWPTLCDPHGLQPARLLCPWDFPGKNTWVGYYFLLQ